MAGLDIKSKQSFSRGLDTFRESDLKDEEEFTGHMGRRRQEIEM